MSRNAIQHFEILNSLCAVQAGGRIGKSSRLWARILQLVLQYMRSTRLAVNIFRQCQQHNCRVADGFAYQGRADSG
jgi:hypothetical protein